MERDLSGALDARRQRGQRLGERAAEEAPVPHGVDELLKPGRPREGERKEPAGPQAPERPREPGREEAVPHETEAEPEDEGPPTFLALTIDEAKATIKEAGGDVIQVGFLASAYRRHLDDDPQSAESAAARKRLGDLVAKRLKDRGLLAPDGTFELQEKPEDLGQRA